MVAAAQTAENTVRYNCRNWDPQDTHNQRSSYGHTLYEVFFNVSAGRGQIWGLYAAQ